MIPASGEPLRRRGTCSMKHPLFFFMLAVLFINSASCTDGDKKKGGVPGSGERESTAQGSIPQDTRADVKVLEEQADNAFTANNLDTAIAAYKSAMAINPDMAELHYKLGLAYGHKMMLNDAIASFDRAIKLDPNHAKACNNLGLAYERKAMLSEAIVNYEKAVAINPGYAHAHYNLARGYSLRRGQYPEFRSLAAEHYYKAGVLFLERGDKQTALAAYRYLQQLDAKELEDALREKLPPESPSGKGSSSP